MLFRCFLSRLGASEGAWLPVQLPLTMLGTGCLEKASLDFGGQFLDDVRF